jgi:hypothetical protein
MDQVRLEPAQHGPQPPDEPNGRRGLAQSSAAEPEPGQGAGPAILPQSGITETSNAAWEGHHGHGCSELSDLGLERAAGKKHHIEAHAGKVVTGATKRGEQNALGPAHCPDWT